MSKPQEGNIVHIHYTGSLDDGSIFDSSEGRDPLQFTIGGGQVIAGFEEAALQLEPGESIIVTIPAEKAYGESHPEMIATIKREQLPPELNPVTGDQLQMQGPAGPLVVRVIEDSPESITIDANHALAGKDLTFKIELVSIA